MFFPLILLDIDNKGLEFINVTESPVAIVHKYNVYNVAWPVSRTAILFLPFNGSVCPTKTEEIHFGLSEKDGSSLPIMQIFDLNKDGIIDERDDFHKHLKVWINKKRDGICRESEVFSLSTFGISLNLDFEEVFETVPNSHTINHKFTYSVDYYNDNGKHISKDGLSGYEVVLQSKQLKSNYE